MDWNSVAEDVFLDLAKAMNNVILQSAQRSLVEFGGYSKPVSPDHQAIHQGSGAIRYIRIRIESD